MPLAQRAKRVGLDPEGRALGEEGAHLGAEALRAADGGPEPLRPAPAAVGLVLGVAVEQVLDELVLVAAGEQLRRIGVGGDRGRPHDLEGEGRDRSRGRAGGRPVDREREAVAQRRRGLTRRA